MSDLQHKIKHFRKHFHLISAFVYVFGSELSSTFPIPLIYVILSFYGTTVDIINETHGSSIMILMRLKKGHSFTFYFNNIKIKDKLTIGFVSDYQAANVLYQIPSFAGLILRKDAHYFYRHNGLLLYNQLKYNDCLTWQTNYSIKISLNFKEFREVSYAIYNDQFPNQFMYHPQKSAIGKNIFSSSSMPIFEELKNGDQFLVIEFSDYNDSLSITNITKN